MLGLSAKCWVSNSSTTIETRMNIRTTPKVVKNALSMLYLPVCPPLSLTLSLKPHRQPGMGAQAKLFGISPPCGWGWLFSLLLSFLAPALACWPRDRDRTTVLASYYGSLTAAWHFAAAHIVWTVPTTAPTATTARTDRTAGTALHLSCAVLLGGVNNNQRAGLATGPAINCHGLASNYVTAQK